MAGTAFVSYQVPEMQQAEVMLLVFAEQTFESASSAPDTMALDTVDAAAAYVPENGPN